MTALTSPGFRSVGFRDIGSPAGVLQPVPGAIAWYRCDEGSGQILHDYSGNGNHGTLGSTSGVDTNDPAWNAQGLVFGGDDNVALPTFSSIHTFECVFFLPSAITAASPRQYLLGAVTQGGVVVYSGVVLGQSVGALTNEIITIISDGSGRSAWCSGTGSIPMGWHHLCTSFVDGAWRIILDGQSLPITQISTPLPIYPHSNVKFGGSGAGDGFFVGGCATASIYNFGLQPSQSQQNLNYWRYELLKKQVILP